MFKNVCDLLGDLYIATGQILHNKSFVGDRIRGKSQIVPVRQTHAQV